jgi:hypothetical protein
MHAIKNFIHAHPLPEEIKQELVGEGILKQHEMYLQLPYWLAPIFGAVTPAQVEQLGISSYLYFRFLLAIDGLMDTPAGSVAADTTGRGTQHLLVYCDLFEKSVRGLGYLFPLNDPFWSAFERCKQQYAGANAQEKRLSRSHSDFSRETFEQLAADKSAVCNAIVYALSSLGGTDAPVAQLIKCLRHVHIALQCVDDVEDFRTDWEQGQYTYAHALVETYLLQEHTDQSQLDGLAVHPYLFTSGTAGVLLSLGEQHFGFAIAIAHELGLTDLAWILDFHSSRCAFHRSDIEQKVAQARAQVASTSSLAA